MWRALCGNCCVEPKGASIGPLPRLWIRCPQSVREHLCFIPFCVMGAKSLQWMNEGSGGGQNLDGAERRYLIWRAICGKADSKAQSVAGSRRQSRKTENFGNRGPFGELRLKKNKTKKKNKPTCRWGEAFQRSFKENGCLWQESERLARRFYLDFRSCRWLSWRFDLLLRNKSTGGIKFSEVVPNV